jgi:hypothetical protein
MEGMVKLKAGSRRTIFGSPDDPMRTFYLISKEKRSI